MAHDIERSLAKDGKTPFSTDEDARRTSAGRIERLDSSSGLDRQLAKHLCTPDTALPSDKASLIRRVIGRDRKSRPLT